jgi:hypothetical protein
MENLSNKSISELEDVLKNYQNEEFERVQICAIELRDRGSGILKATQIANHFGLNDVNELFKKKNESVKLPQSEKPFNNEVEVLTEDKFDKDIIPTTKLVGMISSGLIGLLMIFNGSWLVGLLYAAGGVMATLGLCVLLEGISTIIKLLRKISEK